MDQLLCRFDEADQEAMLADLAAFRRELGWSPRLVTHHLAVTDLTPSELALRCGGRVERSCVVGMGMVQTVRSSSRATGQPYLGSARQAIDLKPPGYSAVFLVTAVPTPDLVVDLFETLTIDVEDLREVPFGTVLPERRYAVGLTTPGGSRRELAWFGGLAEARRFVAERSEQVGGLWVERLSDEAYARRLAEGGFPSRHPGGAVPEGPSGTPEPRGPDDLACRGRGPGAGRCSARASRPGRRWSVTGVAGQPGEAEVVGLRLDGSMMRWTMRRANDVLAPRCVVVSDLWKTFETSVEEAHARRASPVIARVTPQAPQTPYDVKKKAA